MRTSPVLMKHYRNDALQFAGLCNNKHALNRFDQDRIGLADVWRQSRTSDRHNVVHLSCPVSKVNALAVRLGCAGRLNQILLHHPHKELPFIYNDVCLACIRLPEWNGYHFIDTCRITNGCFVDWRSLYRHQTVTSIFAVISCAKTACDLLNSVTHKSP